MTGRTPVGVRGGVPRADAHFDASARLWSRRTNCPGRRGATSPFWSPDSKYIAFFARGKLKKIPVGGGEPQVICNATGREGAWSALDDVILIGGQVGKPLLRVSADGGQPTEETEIDASREDVSHDYPAFLPDGRNYLYMVRSPNSADRVTYVGTIGSKARRELPGIRAGAKYFPTGHVVFLDRGTLMAQRFDIRAGNDPVRRFRLLNRSPEES